MGTWSYPQEAMVLECREWGDFMGYLREVRVDGQTVARGYERRHKVVERALRGAALWYEVKDRLHKNAFGLSGGPQQRLVMARAVAIEPEVILMDYEVDQIHRESSQAIIAEMKQHPANTEYLIHLLQISRHGPAVG